VSRSFHHKPAVREACPLLVGLTGPSGSGKTKSALRLATGIVAIRGGKVVGVDTESNRMLHYAPAAGEKADPSRGTYDFLHIPFAPPHSSDDYKEVILQASKLAEGGCVIIDSMSHEHEGEGGYLEFHDREVERMSKGDAQKAERVTFAGWIKPASARRKLINSILQINCSFVFCFRAKEKLKIVRGKDPVELGWQAIAGEEFVYEMTSRMLLPPGAGGVPSFDASAFEHNAAKLQEQHSAMFKRDAPLDEETGERLARWAAGGAPKPPTDDDGVIIDHEELARRMKECDSYALEKFLTIAKIKSIKDLPVADIPDAVRWVEKRVAMKGR
jgi:energy-coupling factor transporter ATP-binding protein EcfA2